MKKCRSDAGKHYINNSLIHRSQKIGTFIPLYHSPLHLITMAAVLRPSYSRAIPFAGPVSRTGFFMEERRNA